MSSLKAILMFTLAAVAALCLCSVPASARQKGGAARRRAADAARHSNEAAAVLNQIMAVRDKGVPRELLEGAEAVAVCPGVLKAAFVIGGGQRGCVLNRRPQKRERG